MLFDCTVMTPPPFLVFIYINWNPSSFVAATFHAMCRDGNEVQMQDRSFERSNTSVPELANCWNHWSGRSAFDCHFAWEGTGFSIVQCYQEVVCEQHQALCLLKGVSKVRVSVKNIPWTILFCPSSYIACGSSNVMNTVAVIVIQDAYAL